MPLSERLSQLTKTTADLSAIQICQELLRYCNEQHDILEKLKGAGLKRNSLPETVYQLVRRCQEPKYPVDVSNGPVLSQAIQEIINNEPFRYLNDPTQEDVATAYAMAIALDQIYGSRWVRELVEIHGKEEFEVNVNEVFPKSPPFFEAFARQLYGSARLTPKASKRTGFELRPERIALHQSKHFHITVNTRLRTHQLETKTLTIPMSQKEEPKASESNRSPWPRLATGLLNLWQELEWDRVQNRYDSDVIRNVSPRKARGENCFCDTGLNSSEIQLKRSLALLKKCNEMEIDVLVLPELCFDPGLQDSMVESAKKNEMGKYPSILVLGSSHRCEGKGDDYKQKNLLKLVIRHPKAEAVVVDHYKFNPLTDFNDNGSIRHEQLDDTRNMITMVVGEHFSIVPLICKDFLHTNISEIWPVMEPSLILVPALSLVSGPFFDAARTAATSRIATVIADNGFDSESSVTEGSLKNFAVFGLLGNDATGQTGIACEANLDSQQKMPVLFCLTWHAESSSPPKAAEGPPCTVRSVPITQD